jgi:hypothetical protein
MFGWPVLLQAIKALCCPEAAKRDETRMSCFEVLATLCTQYGHVESLADALMAAARKAEHMPPLVAQVQSGVGS